MWGEGEVAPHCLCSQNDLITNLACLGCVQG